jgi:hypothetical protein
MIKIGGLFQAVSIYHFNPHLGGPPKPASLPKQGPAAKENGGLTAQIIPPFTGGSNATVLESTCL